MASEIRSTNKVGDIEVTDAPEVVHVRPKQGPDSRDDTPTSSTVGASGLEGLDGYAADKSQRHGVPQFVGESQMETSRQTETQPVTLMHHWKTARHGWLTYVRTKDFWIVLALG